MRKSHTCPICRKTFWIPDDKDHPRPQTLPFCSERCRLVDLNAWFEGHYKITSPLKPEEDTSSEP